MPRVDEATEGSNCAFEGSTENTTIAPIAQPFFTVQDEKLQSMLIAHKWDLLKQACGMNYVKQRLKRLKGKMITGPLFDSIKSLNIGVFWTKLVVLQLRIPTRKWQSPDKNLNGLVELVGILQGQSLKIILKRQPNAGTRSTKSPMAKLTLERVLRDNICILSNNKKQQFGILKDEKLKQTLLNILRDLKSATKIRDGHEKLEQEDVHELNFANSISWCDGSQDGIKNLLDVTPLLLACPLPFKAPLWTSLDLMVARSLQENEVVEFKTLERCPRNLEPVVIIPSSTICIKEKIVEIWIKGNLILEGQLYDGYTPCLGKKMTKLLFEEGCVKIVPLASKKPEKPTTLLCSNRFSALANEELLDAADLIGEVEHNYAAVATVNTGIKIKAKINSVKRSEKESKNDQDGNVITNHRTS
jgi:hypothetical protein